MSSPEVPPDRDEWSEIARERAPDGVTLTLHRRAAEYEIRAGGRVLMTSREHRSEVALAEFGCRGLGDRDGARVLVGGLGMGFTLRAALDRLPASARVTVAEIVPAVAAWNRGALAALAGRPLDDPRVDLRIADVGAVIGDGATRHDAVLLDVDNGPQGLTRPANHALYTVPGLTAARRALRPGGVLAVWSATRHADFERRLGRAGFTCQVEATDARAVVYLARTAPSPLAILGA